MGCPYTATVNFFHNLYDLVRGHKKTPDSEPQTVVDELPTDPEFDPAASAIKKRLHAVETMTSINEHMNYFSISFYAASTVRGNYPLDVFMGAEDVAFGELMLSEMHGVFRGMVGELGKKLDKSKLPEKLQADMQELRKTQQVYKQHGAIIEEIYHNHSGDVKKDGTGLYGDLKKLETKITKYKLTPEEAIAYKAEHETMETLDATAGIIIEKINGGFDALDTVTLKDGTVISTKIAQAEDDEEIKSVINMGQWLYYAELGAQGFANTLKIPKTMSDAINVVTQSTNNIVPKIANHILNNRTLQVDVLITPFENAVEKSKIAIVRCGDFKNARNSQIAKILGLDYKETYDATVIEAAKSFDKVKTDVSKDKRKSGGVCPMGYSAKTALKMEQA